MIAITRWEFREPREALRVVAVAMEALHRLGVANPARQFHRGLARERSMKTAFPVVVLAKKTPFTDEEEAAVRAHFDAISRSRSALSALGVGRGTIRLAI